MNKVHFLLNKIIYASKRGLKSITLNCTGKQLQYLGILSSLNVLEFYKNKPNSDNYTILISYYYGRPILNSINLVNFMGRGNIGDRK